MDLKTHDLVPIPVPGDPGIPPGSRSMGRPLLQQMMFLTLTGDEEEFVIMQAEWPGFAQPADPNVDQKTATMDAYESLRFTFRYLASQVGPTALNTGFGSVRAGLLEWARFYGADSITSIRSTADPGDNLRAESGLAEWHPSQGSMPLELEEKMWAGQEDDTLSKIGLMLEHVRL